MDTILTAIINMKYICFDYGSKRTGVAISEPSGCMSFPRPMLPKKSRADFFDRIAVLLLDEKPEALVLGLPKHKDGSDSLTTRQVRNFAASLQRRHELPIYLMDERYSSFEAEEKLREAGLKAGEMQDGRLDSAAAVMILDSFLNLTDEERAVLLLPSLA